MDFNYKNIILPTDEYLIVKDGMVIEHSGGVSSFSFENDLDLKVVYFFTRDTRIDYQISKDIKINLTEIYFDLKNDCNININFDIASFSNLEVLSVKASHQESKPVINTNISLAEGSYIKLNELSCLSGACELKTNLQLNQPYSFAEINTVTLNSANEKQAFTINVFHNSKNTKSELFTYGIVKNSSNLNINTDGIIKKGAGKVELKQNTKGLILDKTSQISASPILEIDDFDVIASHGASIGAIDEEILYYLMSRGITLEDSEKLVVSGFINPFLSSIQEGELLEWIKSLINLNI